jgi:hypothetical protein
VGHALIRPPGLQRYKTAFLVPAFAALEIRHGGSGHFLVEIFLVHEEQFFLDFVLLFFFLGFHFF